MNGRWSGGASEKALKVYIEIMKEKLQEAARNCTMKSGGKIHEKVGWKSKARDNLYDFGLYVYDIKIRLGDKRRERKAFFRQAYERLQCSVTVHMESSHLVP
jgi:hypothetical protein